MSTATGTPRTSADKASLTSSPTSETTCTPPSTRRVAEPEPSSKVGAPEPNNLQAKKNPIDDKDLLRLALQKIEELQGQVTNMRKGDQDTPRDSETETPQSARPAAKVKKPDGSAKESKDAEEEPIKTPDGVAVLSHDALRMRLRRMVEKKQSGKCHVPEEIIEDFKSGGELREWLEIALLESIKKIGTDRKYFKSVKAEFKVRCKVVKERMLLKEKEIKGKWVTKEKLEKSGEYSKESVVSILAYCSRFPQALTRPWKYDTSKTEYFLEDETTTVLKMTDTHKRTEEHDHDELDGVVPDHGPEFDDLDFGNESKTDGTEVVGAEVTEDLNKFMDSLQSKISGIFDMVATMRDPENPAPTDRYHLLAKELDDVSSNMEKSFKVLAECMTELKMGKVEKLDPKNPQLVALVRKIKTEKEIVKQPCAELITLEAQYRMLKKAIAAAKRNDQAKRKNENESDKGKKPKGSKKGKPDPDQDDEHEPENTDDWEDQEEEEEEEEEEPIKPKKNKGDKRKGNNGKTTKVTKGSDKKGKGEKKSASAASSKKSKKNK